MLVSTAPLRAATTSMPRAVSRPAGLTVEAKWKVRFERRELGESKRRFLDVTHERTSWSSKEIALELAFVQPRSALSVIIT